MEVYQGVLQNGLRVVYQQVSYSKLSNVGVVVDVGSRDELPEERGVAHFLEHVLFKGTKKRRAYHILNRIDNVGGELNAYTTKEETVLFASVMQEHTSRAMDLLSDIIFNSTFPESELNKEKEVVVDEILSYLDTPFEMVFEDFETQVFKNHPLEKDILGNVNEVRKITRATVSRFIKKHYVPENMVLSYVGGMPLKKFLYWAEKFFGIYSNGQKNKRIYSKANGVAKITTAQKSNFQCHGIIGSQSYSYFDDKKLAMSLLNNFLGGPAMNSRLNMIIREKHGITYNIESNYTPYRDSGLFSIYFGTDIKQLTKVKRLIMNEVNRLKRKPLGSMQLHYAKQQLIGYIALNAENLNGLMLTLGKSKLLYDDIETVEQIIEKIRNLSSIEIQEVANEVFAQDQISELYYLTE